MTVWYSRKPIRLGARGDDVFYRVTADQVAEFRQVCSRLFGLPRKSVYMETCKTGEDAIGRSSGRPLAHVHSDYVEFLENELDAVEVPDGYLELLIYRLKREYALFKGEETEKIKIYFRRKFSHYAKELKLGRVREDGRRDPPDVIQNPEDLDDTTENDDQDYVSKVKRRVSLLNILNNQIENLDLGQRSPLKLTEDPSEKELRHYVRRDKLARATDPGPVVPSREEMETLAPWKKAAFERGWVLPED